MSDTENIWLTDAEKTSFAGSQICKTFYTIPIDILLRGELGSGKTTFLQGIAKELGIKGAVTSPTFALEQRYPIEMGEDGKRKTELLHIDLYRLNAAQAQGLLAATDDHDGIRCIEWPENAGKALQDSHIDLHFSDPGTGGRELTIAFYDVPLPTRSLIEQWRRDVLLPDHIARHCDAVAAFAVALGEQMLQRARCVRMAMLQRSGEVHDLFRFLDFRPGGHPGAGEPSQEERAAWQRVRDRYPGLKHEPACATFLREQGFDALAEVVAVHGLTLPSPSRQKIEQQILFYADKRIKLDERVTLLERFDDFRMRYRDGKHTAEAAQWLAEAKRVEEELFPDGVPL